MDPFPSVENAFNLGVECTPARSGLRWQLSLDNGDVNGTGTSGEAFTSSNRCLAMSVDGRLGKSARLEGKLQKVSAGADGERWHRV